MPAYTGALTGTTEWQSAKFSAPVQGRYFCLEATSGQASGEKKAALAELYLTDATGKDLPCEKWKVVYADSEEVNTLDGRADNVFRPPLDHGRGIRRTRGT